MKYRNLLALLQQMPEKELDQEVLVILFDQGNCQPHLPQVWGRIRALHNPPNDLPGEEAWSTTYGPPSRFDLSKTPVCEGQLVRIGDNESFDDIPRRALLKLVSSQT